MTSKIRATAAVLTAAAALGAAGAPAAMAEFGSDQPANLTQIYKGADNSALYTRADGNNVVGFGEHPGTGMAYVFDATRSGTTLTGKWWDVSKGSRAPSAGTLKLTIAAGGSQLTRTGGADFGPDSFNVISADSVTSWPGAEPAGFQSTAASDLDGAFDGVAGRAYVRDTSDGIVWVAEKSFAPGRPSWVGVFIGKRTSSLEFAGKWMAVPKGKLLNGGEFWGGQNAVNRTWSVTALDGDGDLFVEDSLYKPDYAVDYTKFAQNLDAAFAGKAVGWSWAVAAKGKIVRKNAGGQRRIKGIGDYNGDSFSFMNETENEIASTSKTVTAAAVARALFNRGLTLDAKVKDFLPMLWSRGPGMETVTFRQMLRHVGLKHPGSICNTDPYKCLKDAVQAGIVSDPGYNNIHFTLMRVVLPFIINDTATKEAFLDLDIEDDGEELNQIASDAFRDYVKGMLSIKGVKADFWYTTTNTALGYTFGPPAGGGVAPGQTHLTSGSGGMKFTSAEYAEFLSAFEHGAFVPWSWVEDMKFDRVGFDNQAKDFKSTMPALGELITKNGGTDYVGSQSMLYPSDVQAFVMVNSTGNTHGSLRGELRKAWENALI